MNAAALESTLRALQGRLTDAEAAMVALARTLAVAVDVGPSNAALVREYRTTVAALVAAAGGGADDDADRFLRSISVTQGRHS